MKTVLSVDVAKNKSMIMLMNSDGEILIDTKEIKHNLEDFEKAKEEIKEINPENLTVFMEPTGTYHLPVERYFKENGFNTLVINSLTTKNNYDTIRKTKTDKKDCYRLVKLFFVNEVEYHELSKKDLYANLKAMTRQYFYLLQQNVSCKNRYNSTKQLIAFCGLDPTIKQSGKSINVKGAISKRGNKYARYILFNCSQMVVKLGASNYSEHPVYIYYQNKKSEGKHYYESLTACSTKILRMLYSMCKNNKQFLEN